MESKKSIKTILREYLNESYKLTFNDKQEIEKNIRDKYERYKKGIADYNDSINSAKKAIEVLQNLVKKGEFKQEDVDNSIKKSGYDYYSNLKPSKPMLFNKFYAENIKQVKDDYVRFKSRNTLTNFNYKSKQEKNLKNNEYVNFYNGLTAIEKKSIIDFLKIVSERVNSGDSESIDRKDVRDSFFKTPIKFRQMFSEKPNSNLWRGDYNHPCHDEYDHSDSDYLTMQSFSVNKNVAQDFGFHFNAKNIKNYSGSFSLPLYIEYGDNRYGFGDDEGEVMFFDVVYKCENKTKIL